MKLVYGGLIMTFLLSAAAVTLANELREFPLDEKVRLADVVVIGRAVSTRQKAQVGGLSLEYARVHVDKALKGAPPDEIEVLTKGSIAEANPDCCTTGGVYLLFLMRTKFGLESVNGRFGIHTLPTK